MKGMVINGRDDLDKIKNKTEALVFRFRPSMKDVLTAMGKTKKLKTVIVPKSATNTIAEQMITLLKHAKIELKTSNEIERRTDSHIEIGE